MNDRNLKEKIILLTLYRAMMKNLMTKRRKKTRGERKKKRSSRTNLLRKCHQAPHQREQIPLSVDQSTLNTTKAPTISSVLAHQICLLPRRVVTNPVGRSTRRSTPSLPRSRRQRRLLHLQDPCHPRLHPHSPFPAPANASPPSSSSISIPPNYQRSSLLHRTHLQ